MWVKIVIILLILISTEKLSAELALIYPKPSDSLECGTTINVKWTNSLSKPIDLFYSLDSLNWIPITTNNYSDNYDWIIPNTLKSKAYFKLYRSGDAGVELIWDKQKAHSDWNQVAKFVGNDKLVSVGKEDSIKVWEISTRRLLKTLFIQNSPTNIQATNFAMEYDPDKLLVAQDKAIWTWDLITDKKERIYVNVDLGTARVLDFDPNNREVAVSSNKGYVEIIDLFGTKVAHFNLPNSNLPYIKTIYSLDYSSDGKYLAVAGDDGYIYLINLETEEILQSKTHHGDKQNLTIWCVEISNDNKYILTGGVDNKALLWDFNTLDTLKSFPNTRNVRSSRFDKSSQIFLLSGLNGKIEQYSINAIDNLSSTIDHGAEVLWSEYLNYGDTLVSAGRDGSFKVWKNNKNLADEVYSSVNLYQKMEINFPEIYVNLSEEFDISIEFKGNFDVLDSIKINYSLPIDLADIEGFVENKLVNRDEIFIKSFKNDSITSQVIHQATALIGDRKKGDIKFVDINFYPEGNYRINTDDGFIEIVDTCDIDTSRYIFIEKDESNLEIVNKLENSILEYRLNTIIDGDFEISIFDIQGNKLMILHTTFLKNGYYNFIDDIGILPKGTYFLVTEFEDKILSKKFIK